MTWMTETQLVSMEPQKLWISCVQRSEDKLRETKERQPKINQPGQDFGAQRASRETVQGATGSSHLGAWKQVTKWYSHHSLADPGQICYCSSMMLGVESL